MNAVALVKHKDFDSSQWKSLAELESYVEEMAAKPFERLKAWRESNREGSWKRALWDVCLHRKCVDTEWEIIEQLLEHPWRPAQWPEADLRKHIPPYASDKTLFLDGMCGSKGTWTHALGCVVRAERERQALEGITVEQLFAREDRPAFYTFDGLCYVIKNEVAHNTVAELGFHVRNSKGFPKAFWHCVLAEKRRQTPHAVNTETRDRLRQMSAPDPLAHALAERDAARTEVRDLKRDYDALRAEYEKKCKDLEESERARDYYKGELLHVVKMSKAGLEAFGRTLVDVTKYLENLK